MDNEGPGVYISDGDVIYVMEGDQTAVVDFMDRCTEDAYEQTCEPDPQTARNSGSARTWLFDDEISWTRFEIRTCLVGTFVVVSVLMFHRRDL